MKESTVPQKQESQVPQTREDSRTIAPPVDIFELADGLVAVADLPGVDKSGVDVRVEDDILTIVGKAQGRAPGDSVYREFQLVNYYRQFQLGEAVDQDKIRADLKSGVLTIQLPKAEKAKPKRISVNVAS
jgi:HSP20 family molecular chaperone IbpA